MKRFLPLYLLTLCLFACSSSIFPPTATPAGPVDAVASQVAKNLTAAVGVIPPSAIQNAQRVESNHLLAVYEKSGNLWAWTGTASTQITNSGADSRPRLSADGKLVAFQRGAELWAVEISGQNPRKVFGEMGVSLRQFAFAPASQHLYFTTAASDGSPRFDLNMADGNSSTILLPPGQGGEFTFAPAGEMLALVQPQKISIVQADGSNAQVVYEFKAVDGNYLPHVAWLENGYGFKTVIPGAGGKPARLMFIMAAGGQAAQLAQFNAAPHSVSDTFIAPDGSKVLYVREQGGKLEVHVIDASTADQLLFSYARGQLGILGWTPDSKNIIFWLDNPRQTWMAAGDNRAPLSDVAYAANVTWLTSSSYVFLNETELRLRSLNQPSQLLDTGVTGSFDAIPLP